MLEEKHCIGNDWKVSVSLALIADREAVYVH
mgnify:CR=1 FL=1